MTTDAINVAYCFDRAYAPYCAVSTYSLLVNSKSDLHIYWGVPPADAELAGALAKALRAQGGDIRIVPLQGEDFEGWKTAGFSSLAVDYTVATYLRLHLPDAVPERRTLYLDCDTLVLHDLRELYDTEMEGNVIGGVLDSWCSAMSKVPRVPEDGYVNTGVLLMDLEALRAEGFLTACRSLYATHKDDIAFVDQCLINKFAEMRKLLLPEKWNRRVFSGSRNANHFAGLEDAAILHFVSRVKPWHEASNESAAALWWAYAERAGVPRLRRAAPSATG